MFNIHYFICLYSMITILCVIWSIVYSTANKIDQRFFLHYIHKSHVKMIYFWIVCVCVCVYLVYVYVFSLVLVSSLIVKHRKKRIASTKKFFIWIFSTNILKYTFELSHSKTLLYFVYINAVIFWNVRRGANSKSFLVKLTSFFCYFVVTFVLKSVFV